MGDLVQDWYGRPENVEEMRQWVAGKLKKWERRVVNCFPQGANVLDVGCGMGREAFALAELGFSVVGIDISEEAIGRVRKLAEENRFSIPFLHYDGQVLPFPNGAFDVVIIWAQTFGLLYGDESKGRFLRECRRVLRDGGLISFSGHDYEYLLENHNECLVGRRFHPYSNAEIYWETFVAGELKCFAQREGFEVLLCERGEVFKPSDGVILHCLAKK